MEKPQLLILTGPTAVGKTHLSILLAKAVGGEIVSADSIQVYRHMDIGSGKIKKEQMQGIRHHLLDVLEPTEEFNVVRFQQLANAAIRDIYAAGKIPILVGGTGFYIQAVLYGIDFTQMEEDTAYRAELEELARTKGPDALHEMLRQADAESAAKIHPNNIRRVIRALEYYHASGEPISEHNRQERSRESPYRFSYFVLTQERQALYEQIDRRVDDMLADGLVQEVERLVEMGCTREMTSMQGLGYQEILQYLEGEVPYEEAVRRIKRDTRHFAKRQLTWFRRERDVIWLDRRDYPREEDLLARMIKSIP